MAIDRSKFKPTSVAKQAESDKAVKDAMSTGRQRPGMLDVESGSNVFRIFPGHPVEGRDYIPFSQPSVKVFLPAMVDEIDKDTKKPTGQKRKGQKPIFNGRIHGGFEKDLVEEYIKLARAYAEAKWGNEEGGKNAKSTYLDKVYGKFNPANPSSGPKGIKYQTGYVMYAKKMNAAGTPFGRLEVKSSVKEELNRLSAEETAGDPLGVDPYTDLDSGYPINIDFDNGRQGKDKYKVSIKKDFDKQTKQLIEYPISEAELEKFAEQPTLESMYVKVFTIKDFQYQLEGLELFDKDNGMGIVSTPEYEAVVEEIKGYFSGSTEEEEEVEVEEENDEEEGGGDQFSFMSRIELKEFSRKEKLGLKFQTTQTDEDVRNSVRAAFEAAKIPHIPLPGEDDYEEEEAPKPSSTAKSSTIDRLKNLSKK